MPIDETAPSFGLPSCLRIPIAARDIESIRRYVGEIVKTREWNGRVNAVSVKAYDTPVRKTPTVRLWTSDDAEAYEERLHPSFQVWVHVDYTRYRKAYEAFAVGLIPPEHVLDHIQNRRAIRLRGYTHPYLRLCPVSRSVNSSGGSLYGGEGMELQHVVDSRERGSAQIEEFGDSEIRYADPMDITKMLNIPPGLHTLSGVRDMLKLLYP